MFIAALFWLYLAISYLQRTLYVVWILISTHSFPTHLSHVLGKGFLFDLAAGFFMFLPACIYMAIIPKRWAHSAFYRAVLLFLSLTPLLLAAIAAMGEIFFFEEFHARYNFIAVDYLIYTTEVVRNVLESYSVFLLAAGMFIPAIFLFVILRSLVRRMDRHALVSRAAVWRGLAFSLFVILCGVLVSEDKLLAGEPYWPRELSKNSVFALFSAYEHNSINYKEFYSSLDSQEARKLVRQALHGNFADGPALVREIRPQGAEKHFNVVLVAMESMSAGFLAHFGNRLPVTPNLDNLADAGVFYTGLYATGTRTVRGLEALMLSLPPTPGQSILRRPNSDKMFNLGGVFSDHGYKTQFIYGGYAYFDNMREWFESNGFEVVDRATFPSAEIQFGNAWGVCDEDLFSQVLKQQEATLATGKPFFQVVLTTSNHRPYTFPEGRIDIPPHTGREGAIKYSDYAIGKFIETAKTKPWFKNTIFIFVADHDASVAGGMDIPVHDYLIPAIFYNPTLLAPRRVSKLASQIDLAPTLLGLLNFSYDSKFFGEDLATTEPNRAFLGTYQKVALLRPGSLTILAPGRSVEAQELDDNYNVKKSLAAVVSEPLKLTDNARDTIAIYQSASELFVEGLLKTTAKATSARK